jgi:hypothetical protein
VSQLQHCHNYNTVTTTTVSQLQHCHNYSTVTTTTLSQLKMCFFFQEKLLKVLKCYNFLRVQQQHNCSPAVSFANCVTTLYLLKVHLQTFLAIPITQKCQILSCDTLSRMSDILTTPFTHPTCFGMVLPSMGSLTK